MKYMRQPADGSAAILFHQHSNNTAAPPPALHQFLGSRPGTHLGGLQRPVGAQLLNEGQSLPLLDLQGACHTHRVQHLSHGKHSLPGAAS